MDQPFGSLPLEQEIPERGMTPPGAHSAHTVPSTTGINTQVLLSQGREGEGASLWMYNPQCRQSTQEGETAHGTSSLFNPCHCWLVTDVIYCLTGPA